MQYIEQDTNSNAFIKKITNGLQKEKQDVDEVAFGRLVALTSALTRPLFFLRDHHEFKLNDEVFASFLNLDKIDEELIPRNKRHGYHFEEIMRPIKIFVATLPGYDSTKRIGNQSNAVQENFNHLANQIKAVIGSNRDDLIVVDAHGDVVERKNDRGDNFLNISFATDNNHKD